MLHSNRFLPYSQTLDQYEKIRQNQTIQLFCSGIREKGKRFITLIVGVNVKELFSFSSLMLLQIRIVQVLVSFLSLPNVCE
jgi:hypothetical protein